MCSFTAAMAGVSTGLSLYGEYASQKALAANSKAQMEAQKTAAIQNLTHMFQNYEEERRDAFDAAVMDIDKINRNADETNSQVEAAINEGYSGGGRTADMLNRSVRGDVARATMSRKDNYMRKSNEIDLNKEAAWQQTEYYLKGVNASAPKMPSRMQNALTGAGIILNGYTKYRNLYEDIKNKTYGGGNGRTSTGKAWAEGGISAGTDVGDATTVNTLGSGFGIYGTTGNWATMPTDELWSRAAGKTISKWTTRNAWGQKTYSDYNLDDWKTGRKGLKIANRY